MSDSAFASSERRLTLGAPIGYAAYDCVYLALAIDANASLSRQIKAFCVKFTSQTRRFSCQGGFNLWMQYVL
jgi:hypothetical protein